MNWNASGTVRRFRLDLAQGQNGVIASLLPTAANLVLGFIIGAIVLAVVKAIAALRGSTK